MAGAGTAAAEMAAAARTAAEKDGRNRRRCRRASCSLWQRDCCSHEQGARAAAERAAERAGEARAGRAGEAEAARAGSVEGAFPGGAREERRVAGKARQLGGVPTGAQKEGARGGVEQAEGREVRTEASQEDHVNSREHTRVADGT